jgi:hypothetical protein
MTTSGIEWQRSGGRSRGGAVGKKEKGKAPHARTLFL